MRLLSFVLLLTLISRTALPNETWRDDNGVMDRESESCQSSEMVGDCQSCSNCPPCNKPMVLSWGQKPCCTMTCPETEKNMWPKDESACMNNQSCNSCPERCDRMNTDMRDSCPMMRCDDPFLVRLVKFSLKSVPYLMTFAYFKYLADYTWTNKEGEAYINKSANKILELGIGIWLYERIKADAKGIESMFFNGLSTLAA